MTPAQFKDRLVERHHAAASEHAPWLAWALHALNMGWYHMICGRTGGDDLYLARFWMIQPEVSEGAEHGCGWDSQCSMLLHCIIRGDDDEALHCHPWEDFTTTILSGGYSEEVPHPEWNLEYVPFKDDRRGPMSTVMKRRNRGESVFHYGKSLHRICQADPETWTLVQTGRRLRDWGFHPAGERWVDHKTYLESRRNCTSDEPRWSMG